MFMFGYVKINKMDLTFREYEHYRGYYCGLCKYLKDNHGEISRVSLNYDITFLILILTAVYKPKSTIIEEGCITNPFKKKKKIIQAWKMQRPEGWKNHKMMKMNNGMNQYPGQL